LVPEALLAFSFAMIFTLVFTLLSVSSEKSRSQMERLAGELSAANHKLRESAVQAAELAATRERNRLAREIHDSLGHYLTVVNVQIEAARALWIRDPAQAQDALAKAQSFTREGLQDIRRSVATLRASPLDNKPLVEALRLMVDESRPTGLAAELKLTGEVRPLSPAAELTLYRAGQEGMTNVRKHARASRVSLALDFQAGEKVCLRVSDDGIGALKNPNNGFGLIGLRERAQILGGEVRVHTAPQAGFTLEIVVPG
jgi:signal transduction histidine kinase